MLAKNRVYRRFGERYIDKIVNLGHENIERLEKKRVVLFKWIREWYVIRETIKHKCVCVVYAYAGQKGCKCGGEGKLFFTYQYAAVLSY